MSILLATSLFASVTGGAALPALAAGTAVVAQTSQTESTISGTVLGPDGTPITDAHATVTGPANASATSGPDGTFVLHVIPGVYRVVVSKSGYTIAQTPDVAVTAGETRALSVSMAPASLSSLQTIGTVTSTGRGATAINTSSSTQTFVTAQAFENLANPQINSILARVPDVTVQQMGSQKDTSIVVGGLQPYETQVLIDGHPIALGQYGVWLSQYFPNYLVGGMEVQSGPGNTTAFANVAVGGTANILTPGFTKKRTTEFITGADNYSSQYSSFLTTGSLGKLSYVVDIGTSGANGPNFKKQACAVLGDPTTTANQPGSAGIVQFCGDFSGSLVNKAMLYKLKYDFSPATAFEAGYVGSFGGYSPQGSAWGNQLGMTTIEGCFAPVTGTSNNLQCSNPAYKNLIGKTVNAVSYYPGTNISNTQQLWTGQLRTSLGNNTILIRPYLGSIQPESYDGANEGAYASFWGPAPGSPDYPGAPSLAPGTHIPASGLAHPNGFEADYGAGGACPTGNIYSFSQINSPSNTVVAVNGQEECFQYPYTFYEQDKLYGTTFSFIHPFGDNTLDFTYDFHGQSTFAYANAPTNVTVPFSANRFSTFSLTADLHPSPKVGINIGLYNTLWSVSGSKAVLDSAGNPVLDAFGSPVVAGLQRSVSRFDPHIALSYRPSTNDSIRAAFGTSETFPFLGDVSGTAAFQPFAQSAPLYTLGIFTEKNPNLQPEYSLAYSLGADHRFRNGAVISGDLQYSIIHNVFQQLTLAENTTFQGQNGVLGIFTPVNVARLTAKVATVKYTYAPRYGLGYNVSAAADSSILTGIPAAAYNANPGFPANNVQVCGNALFTPGLATCIPYLKGYGQITYAWHNGTYAGLGIDYEGKNNPYYQPPLALLDLTLRRPITKTLEMQLSVENLLNTNAFSYLPAPNVGVPIVANSSFDGSTISQVTYNSTLLPAIPRTLRLQLRLHAGR